MSELTFKSAGVSARTIDQTGPTNIEPQGVPAGVIGTSVKGPAFVPTTVATGQDFTVQFGAPNNDHFNAPLAVNEWLANQQSATFTRVLGIGTGLRRDQTNGSVVGSGFVVGEELPQDRLGGALGGNPYANAGGPLGRTFFLAAFMSESFVTVGSSSIGSNYISKSFVSSSGVTYGEGLLYLRGVIMAPSGVFPTLSSSFAPSDAPASTLVADSTWGSTNRGSITGSVYLSNGRQEFVMLLNGHKGTDVRYPNVITASFDVTAPNYFVNVMNTDPLKIEEAGHCVYAEYPIHPSQAVVTGSGIVLPDSGSSYLGGFEQIAVLTNGSAGRNPGGSPGQNFESFEDRFRHAYSPWIISQGFNVYLSGSTTPAQNFVNLFRLHAKDAGQYPNNRIKFSIENITPGTDARPYGTFDLLVRDMTDTDKTRNVLEAFRGLSLDPSSDRYIAKVIGDINTFYNFDTEETSQGIVTLGDYPSRSNFIRVEMSSQVENGQVSEDVLPFGFRGMDYLWSGNKSTIAAVSNMYVTASTIGGITIQPPIPMRDNIVVGSFPNQSVDRGLYWGVQFTRKTNTAEPNSSTIQESSIASFAKYFPNFDRTATVSEGDVAFSANYRADYESSNLFSLSKIKVARNQTTDLVDTNQFVSWSYVRNGDITTSGAVRALVPSDLADASVRQAAKFSFFMQGGFDGTNPFNYNESVMNNFAIQEEMTNANRGVTDGPTVKAYSKALDLIADTTEVDIQLLAVPGIRHSVITDKALLVTEARFDALYLMDIDQYDSSNLVVSGTNSGQITSVNFTANAFRNRGLNSSFGAAFFPDVNIRDNVAGAVRTVAPSVAVLGAFGLNDTIGHPWFAPAGFTRGALKNVTDSAVNLNRNNLDALQTVNINPLASFANSQGVTVWGQKTLLATESALERVNVRRLLIDIRRKVKRVSDRIVFEQNRAETLARFEQLVKPILKNIQDQAGVERYLVKIDTETTTQADIQNRTIRGKIYVQPTKTLEFLDVAFVLTNNG